MQMRRIDINIMPPVRGIARSVAFVALRRSASNWLGLGDMLCICCTRSRSAERGSGRRFSMKSCNLVQGMRVFWHPHHSAERGSGLQPFESSFCGAELWTLGRFTRPEWNDFVVVILLQIEALGVLGQGIWKEFRTARSVDQLWNVKIAKMLGKDNILRATYLSPLQMIRRQTGDAPGRVLAREA